MLEQYTRWTIEIDKDTIFRMRHEVGWKIKSGDYELEVLHRGPSDDPRI